MAGGAGNEPEETFVGSDGTDPVPIHDAKESMMIELVVAGTLGVMGHLRSRDFVGRRLRYTEWVEKPGIGLAAGVATAIVAAPVVWALPLVGAGTAIALGAGVGSGVAIGAARARRGGFDDD